MPTSLQELAMWKQCNEDRKKMKVKESNNRENETPSRNRAWIPSENNLGIYMKVLLKKITSINSYTNNCLVLLYSIYCSWEPHNTISEQLDHLMLGDIVKGPRFLYQQRQRGKSTRRAANIVIKSLSLICSVKSEKLTPHYILNNSFQLLFFTSHLYASNNAACVLLPYCSMCKKNALEQHIKPNLRLNYKRKHFILRWRGQHVTTNVSGDLVSFDGVFRTISGISIWWQVCMPEFKVSNSFKQN